MFIIGQSMPSALRETAEGGLAATPTGKRLEQEIFGMNTTFKLKDLVLS
jgi:L-serine dehydratase